MKVFDAIMFAGEADMLYFRLEQLDGKVDRHIIVEATQTHRGLPRELWIPRHLDCCLRPWRDRITYVRVDFPQLALGPWEREHYQRDQTWNGLAPYMTPDDWVLISDCDEIPSDAALAPQPTPAVAIRQRVFHSAVDWEYPEPQLTSVAVRAGNISWVEGSISISRIRDARDGLPVVENGGWHFSWLGTNTDRQDKLARSCHLEMSPVEHDAIGTGETFETGRHYAPDCTGIRAVEVDETWPEYIQKRKCPPNWFRPV